MLRDSIEFQEPLFASNIDNLLSLPQRPETEGKESVSGSDNSLATSKKEPHKKSEIVFHDTIKAIKRSLASRGSSRHKLSVVEYSVIEQSEAGDIKFKTSPYRWVILALFCGLIMNELLMQVGFSAFVAQIQIAYDVEALPVVMLITVPTLLFAPVTLFATTVLAKWKINNLLKLAAVF